jgi:hypothetical protein
VAQIKEALKGNTRAAQFIRDTIGEMPITEQKLSGTLTASTVIIDHEVVEVERD